MTRIAPLLNTKTMIQEEDHNPIIQTATKRDIMRLRSIISLFIAKTISLILPRTIMKNKQHFRVWENRGYHVTPVHYSEPIPYTRTLKENLWTECSELVGVDINTRHQLELLSVFVNKFRREYNTFPLHKTSNPTQYYIKNDYFESVDGEILYCMIRFFKPARIVEIGSGYSTMLSAAAVLKNREEDAQYKCEFVTIDPYPDEILKQGLPGLSKLIVRDAQQLPISDFERLTENDIVFIDSSHVLKIGSDVKYEYLEILPRLNRGVLFHAHDIFIPAEYPKNWVLEKYRFWNEQYLLQAFLAFNNSFEVLWAGSYMHLKHPDELEAAFSSYKRDETRPGSFWIKKIK